ncbi:MAG TPA: DNA-binding response regulator [Cytophagales bacterium]|nr:DNA-binding response regulator [Cytophagales bacterium]HAP59033.1 DNA-binding response regulator [Cytophagales bacterium]
MIRGVIVEDEPLVAQRLERMLGEALVDHPFQLWSLRTLAEARAFLDAHPVDVVFLDLNLHGENGFDLLKESVAQAYHTVVISAYHDKALQAFEYGVLDFIGKPFTHERLQTAIYRLLDAKTTPTHQLKYLAVRTHGRLQIVPLQEVLYLQAHGAYSQLHMREGTPLLHDKSLAKLQQILPSGYERIHKSYIVELGRIRHLNNYGAGKYEAVLVNKETLPVSRQAFKSLKLRWE